MAQLRLVLLCATWPITSFPLCHISDHLHHCSGAEHENQEPWRRQGSDGISSAQTKKFLLAPSAVIGLRLREPLISGLSTTGPVREP